MLLLAISLVPVVIARRCRRLAAAGAVAPPDPLKITPPMGIARDVNRGNHLSARPVRDRLRIALPKRSLDHCHAIPDPTAGQSDSLHADLRRSAAGAVGARRRPADMGPLSRRHCAARLSARTHREDHVRARTLRMAGNDGLWVCCPVEFRPSRFPSSSCRRFGQSSGSARRCLHVTGAANGLVVGQTRLGHLLGMGCAPDVGAGSLLPLSRADRAAILHRGRSFGRPLDGVLAVLGVVMLPIIKYSVTWWSTLHQPSTGFGSTVDPSCGGRCS